MLKIQFIGNIGKDAVVREVSGAKAISFTVAVNESYVKKGGEKVETKTWLDCTIWRGADKSTKIAEFLKKGQQVFIEGKPKAGGYQNEKQETVHTIEVRVADIQLLGARPGATAEEVKNAGAFINDDDNDLPF